ncbi:MAG: ATP-binding protein [Spirochaetota bacterium]|nr:ATP-binding protein [Spirochaetota bacterium]
MLHRFLKKRTIIFLFIFLASRALFAQEPINIQDNLNGKQIGKSLYLLEDKSKSLTIQDIITSPHKEKFVRSEKYSHNFGHTSSVYWVRFDVRNSSDRAISWLLEVSYPLLDFVDIYIPTGKQQFQVTRTGDKIPFSSREVDYRKIMFSLTEKPRSLKTYYLRFKSEGAMIISLYMWSPINFTDFVIKSETALGLFYGILLIMIFYNLFVFLSIRDNSYLYYVIFIFGMTVYYLVIDGVLFQYLPHELGFWTNKQLSMIAFLVVLFGLQFIRSFLHLKNKYIYLDKAVKIVMSVILLSFVLSPFTEYRYSSQLSGAMAIVAALFSMTLGVHSFIKKFRPARFLLIAWFTFLSGAIIQSLRNLGIIPDNLITSNFMRFGSISEVFLLSLALGDRINILRKEKEVAQNDSINNLTLLNKRLNELDKLKDEFLANISHELKTPLNSIIGFTESIIQNHEKNQLTKKVNNELSLVMSASKQLNNLVNDILDFSMLKNDEMKLNKTPVDLFMLLTMVLKIVEPMAKGKDVRLINNIPGDISCILADENRLIQIMNNLLSNAIKFTEKGEVVVSANSIENNKIELVVSDTGIGIPQNEQAVIFKYFYQVDGSASRWYGGTGLGLAITKKLIELHDSEIRVKSEPGKGSQFSFHLPATEEKPSQKAPGIYEVKKTLDFNELADHSELSEPDGFLIHPDYEFQILVVEDDLLSLYMICDYLSFTNCKIDKATSGPDALSQIKDKMFDLIILDVMMPGMSGYQVCEKIREDFNPSELPVLLLTAKNHLNDLLLGFQHGANDYITKPVLKDELLSRVKLHLNLITHSQMLRNVNENLENLVSQRTSELRESEKKYRHLVELSPDWIILHKNHDIEFINNSLVKDLGYSLDNGSSGLNLKAFFPPHHFEQLSESLKQIEKTGSTTAMLELKLWDKQKNYYDTECLSTILDNGEPPVIMTIIRDVSERKRIQNLKNDMEHIVRHDLKNQFHTIRGFTDLIKTKFHSLTEENLNQYLTHITSCVKRAEEMIHKSIDLYKMEIGHYQMNPAQFDLMSIFKKMHDSFDSAQKAKSINMVYLLNDEKLDWDQPFLFKGEENYIETMFYNLLQNAVQASPNNNDITIKINEHPDEANPHIEVDIHNAGVIPENIRDSFFERYVTSGKDMGIGLGTYSALMVARAHGGNIHFTSSEENGTHLIVILPL